MTYANQMQVCLLTNSTRVSPSAFMEDVTRSVDAYNKSEGALAPIYFIPDMSTPTLLQFKGARDLMVSFELVDRKVDGQVMAETLGSLFSRMMAPNALAIMQEHTGHILINVQHGLMAGPQVEPMLVNMLGDQVPWGGRDEFFGRMQLCCEVALGLMLDNVMMVHWGQSNTILERETFIRTQTQEPRIPLHIHPALYSPGEDAQGNQLVGFVMYGSELSIGKLIVFDESPVHVGEAFLTALTYIARVQAGYTIPHNDTFGDEDNEYAIQVQHFAENTPGVGRTEAHTLLRYMHHAATGYVNVDRSEEPLVNATAEELRSIGMPEDAIEEAVTQAESTFAEHGIVRQFRRKVEPRADTFPQTYGGDAAGGEAPVLDPADPTDRAILDAMREREAEKAREAVSGGKQGKGGLFRKAFGRRKSG